MNHAPVTQQSSVSMEDSYEEGSNFMALALKVQALV